MKFEGLHDEVIFVSRITPERSYMFNDDLKTKLSIVWNTSDKAVFHFGKQKIELGKNCILFLTEFHKITEVNFNYLNIIQFNRDFHCVEKHDQDIGCKGLLFFGAADIPKITIPKSQLERFEMLWKIFVMEVDETDGYTLDMLRSMLKRFLILCVRIYRTDYFSTPIDDSGIALIREYNYLVEKYFKKYTRVSEYANILYKSPKTLSNTFSKYIDKTPLQIINERRMLEAKQLLAYTDTTIQEIAEELNFQDSASFSHFFKSRQGKAPSAYRVSLKEVG